jgi:CHAT domain-containing protein
MRRARLALALAALALALAALALTALGDAGAQDRCGPAPGAEVGEGASDASPAAQALERANEQSARGDAAGALVLYDESRALARSDGDAALATLAAANAARAALEAGDLGRAERDLPGALVEAEGFPDLRVRSRLLVHVGRTWALLAVQRPGGDAARRAAATLTRAASESRAAGDPRNEAYALGWLGELYERGGRTDAALELTQRALDAGLRADAPDALYRWQWQAGRIHRASGRPDQALASYRGAVTTLERLREQTASSGSDFAAAFGGAGELYLEFVDLLLARVVVLPDAVEREALLRETLAALESQKVDELRDYFRDECLAAQRRAAPDTIPGAIVVYPVVLADRLELIVGGDGALERYSSPVDRETFTAEVRALRYTLARRTTREYLRHAQRLYDWIIRPLEPTLESRRPRALVFVPGGALRTIPFAALHDREREAFLIERVPVAILPGLTLTDPRPLPRANIRLLAAGISEAVDGYPPVVRVEQELAAVHEAFPGRALLNEQFAVARFVEEVEEHPFGIVHVASHAEFSGDSSGSFLLAYDGKISLERLASVVGSTRFRAEQPLELLALSACETAAGNDRAALGLAGIALRAGARSALATLWSVNDEAAAKLVTGFYRELGNPELSRAEALREAQLELLRTREWGHPALWAPFVLISSWL